MADETPKAELMIDIMNSNLSVDEVKERIRQLEKEYGENYVLDYDLEEAGIERKPQSEWDEEYYENVKTKGILGIASKQYFLYFAELNQYIQSKRLEEQKVQQRRKRIKLIIAAIIAVICIAIVLLLLSGGLETNATSLPEMKPLAENIQDIHRMMFYI